MSFVKSRNPETGIVYVYSSESYFDEHQNKYRYKRRVVGKLDENGNIIPTGPRGGYHPRKNQTDSKPETSTVSTVRNDVKTDEKTNPRASSESDSLLSRLKDSEDKNRQLEQKILLLQKDLADTQKKLDRVRNTLNQVLADIS